ncbi:MAG TPA: zinc ABC transporter substrate-binding protein [Miltoncostaeaceae bacterium]|nr:zinc ABC transporter substrate-binding protein [Miltoncostaeaceae bacterium]
MHRSPTRRSRLLLLAALALLIALPACVQERANPPEAGPGGVRVVATTNIVADLVRQVGGDRVRVEALMGPGIDPHAYKASAGDVRRLRQATLIVYGGLELEGKMADVFADLGTRIPTVAVAEGLPEDRLIPVPDFAGRYDPHVWNDPDLWGRAGLRLADALAAADPAHAGEYRGRARAYRARVQDLEARLREELAAVPPRRRVLVTSHDAFGYFGRAFDFEVAGIQGVSTATEASTADVDRIARLVAERGVRTIFVESSVPPQTVQAVRAAARARGAADVRVGEELYSDSAGDAGTPEGTYEGMLAHNVRAIRDGLADPAGVVVNPR